MNSFFNYRSHQIYKKAHNPEYDDWRRNHEEEAAAMDYCEETVMDLNSFDKELKDLVRKYNHYFGESSQEYSHDITAVLCQKVRFDLLLEEIDDATFMNRVENVYKGFFFEQERRGLLNIYVVVLGSLLNEYLKTKNMALLMKQIEDHEKETERLLKELYAFYDATLPKREVLHMRNFIYKKK